MEVYAPLWQDPACATCPIPIGLGGHDERGREALRDAVTRSIACPLGDYGSALDPARLTNVLV